MKRSILILIIMFCLTTDRVYASHAGDYRRIVIVCAMASLFADVGLTARDAVLLLEGKRASYKHGVFETVVALPQALFFAKVSVSWRDNRAFLLTAWTAALTAHGIWTIKSSISQRDLGMKKQERFNISVAPTLIPTYSGAMHVGVGMNVRF